MHVSVDFLLPSGETVTMGHGSIVGRLWSADLHLNDARVSEAHAMVSLRGRDVHLLALRGRFQVRGKTQSDVVLTPGMQVSFAPGLVLEVAKIQVPEQVLACEAPGVPRQVLRGVTSLFGTERPAIVHGWKKGADDYLWPTGDSWMRGRGDGVVVSFGDEWEVGLVRFRAVGERISGAEATEVDPRYHQPLRVIARYDTVQLVREGHPTVLISGHMARVLSDLVVAQAPISWQDLAVSIWGDLDKNVLRRRWDMQLVRFRQKLRAQGIREDLLSADGSGLLELLIGPGDTVVDET
jgi:hypothetical protein